MAVPRQEVGTLPLPQAVRHRLLRAGITTTAELGIRRLRELSEGDTPAACHSVLILTDT